MKIDRIGDTLSRRLTSLDSADAGQLRHYTLEHFRSSDEDWPTVHELRCEDVARLKSLHDEEGERLTETSTAVVLGGGRTIEQLLATNHETVQVHNREWKSGRTHRERHERRRAIKRVVYELDRMVWLAADAWFQRQGKESIFRVSPPLTDGLSLLPHPAPKPRSPALRERTLRTSDSLGPSRPEPGIPQDWCDRVMPATWSLHDVREFVLSKSIWKVSGREVVDEQLKFRKKYDWEVLESQLAGNETYCGGLMDAFLAARELGTQNSWSDLPQLPEERSLSCPLSEEDIESIDEISSLLAGLVDWLDSKAASGNVPTVYKISQNSAEMPAGTATLTWLQLACESGAQGDALRQEAAEQILKREGLEQKSGKWTETQHRYVLVTFLLYDTVLVSESSEPVRTPAECRKLIDQQASGDKRAGALIPESETHKRTKWIADGTLHDRHLKFCKKSLKKVSDG